MTDESRDPAASLGSLANAGNPAAYLVEVEGIGSIMPICRDMVEVDGLRERFGERVRGVTPLYAWREWDEIRRAGEQVSREEGYKVMEAELIAIAAERDWIPVAERLPEEGQEVLVASPCPNSDTPNIDISSWGDEGTQEPVWREADCGRIWPTHWMPLPAPPTDAK